MAQLMQFRDDDRAPLSIACPKCGMAIPITDAIKQQLRAELDVEYEERLALERSVLEEAALSKAREAVALEHADIVQELNEKAGALAEFRDQELALRRAVRKLEEEKEGLELELHRRVDEERSTIAREMDEKYGLKLAEKDKQLAAVRRELDEARRKATQSSQPVQGIVQEEWLGNALRERFPNDEICPIRSGKRGADLLQVVKTPSGRTCGQILWETKNASRWSGDWIEKLKEDQRREKADSAVLVSSVLPIGTGRISTMADVWVSDLASAPELAAVLRVGLIEMARRMASLSQREDVRDAISDYLSSKEFTERVKAIAGYHFAMLDVVEHQQQVMERCWSNQRGQIRASLTEQASMVGELQAVGVALDELGPLDLPGEES